MNSAGLSKWLEYSISQRVNASRLVNTITLCNLIASLHASFTSWASPRLPLLSPPLTGKLGHFIFALIIRRLRLFTAAPTQQVLARMRINQA